jgi:hypothetical protein
VPNSVGVTGLRELRKALAAADSLFPRELSHELRDLAGDVREAARRRLEGDVEHSTGRAAGSIRAVILRGGAGVRAGGARVPYYGWLDFGGTIRHHGSQHHHDQPHLIRREFVATGRYLYPAADEQAALLAPKVERLIERVMVRAGFTD